MIGSVIAFIVLIILLAIAYFYKYGFPIVDWSLVLVYLIPSSILFFIHLIVILFERVKADEVKDYLSRLEYSLSAKYNAETDKAKGIIESLSNIQQSKDNAIKEVNDTIKELKSNQEIDFAENERECNERMDKALNDKFDSIANKSKINEFSKQVEKLDNSLIELQNTKKELSNIKNEMNYLDETHQKVIGFIEYILKDIKLTKKKQEEYEERLAMLKKKLASGIRGEEWKQVKKEYDEMKDFKYSD